MISAYLSHPIRGAKGAAATRKDMDANNQRAMEFAAKVREAFPGLELYVPAEHDEFVITAYEKGYLDEKQILNVDGQLIASRDFVILYVPERHISGGMLFESEVAAQHHKPVAITAGEMWSIYYIVEDFIS